MRPWFSPFRPMRVFMVEGTPWTEDMNLFPSSKLRVDIADDGAEMMNQEGLYHLFRRFGKIKEISIQSTLPAVKDSPKFALVEYVSVRSATAARNCLYRARVGAKGGLVRIGYQKTARSRWVMDWLFSHPKIGRWSVCKCGNGRRGLMGMVVSSYTHSGGCFGDDYGRSV